MSGNWRMLGYVFLGGSLGTMLRYLIFELINESVSYPTGELIAIFTVNLIGSYFLGVTARHPIFQSENKSSFWGVGFAGGFTTMSAVTLFVDYNFLTYEFAVMLFAGVILYGIGYHQGRRVAKKRAS